MFMYHKLHDFVEGMQIPFQALLVVRNPKVATQWSPLVL